MKLTLVSIFIILVFSTQIVLAQNDITNDSMKSFTPLVQFKTTHDVEKITCQVNLVEIIKAEDGYPACVIPEHASQLMIRGWAISDNHSTDNSQNTMKVTGSNDVVKYDMTTGKLLGIIKDVQGKNVFIPIRTEMNGVLQITLPKTVIDIEKKKKNDTFYIATNSGRVNFFNESDTSLNSTFTIPFKHSDNMINIIALSWLQKLSR